MKLLIEQEDISNVKNLIEESVGGKKYYIEGIFAQSEVRNRNGRLYPKQVMEKAIADYQPTITSKRSMGEIMHPNTPSINLERVSHLIESLTWDGNNVNGRARILTEMPQGKIAKGLIDEGVQIGVSTRAVGSLLERDGNKIVQGDLVLSTVDIVGDPSGPECFVNGIMENASWIYESGVWKQQELDAAKSIITRANSKELVEKQIKLFEWLLNNVK